MDSDFSRACGRAEELMGFLYGELNDADANAFRAHMQDCATCNSELQSFGNIRSSVIAWRNESFNSLSSPARVNVHAQNRSAVVAIREFFNLSPLWMKAAVGFASILFCVLAVAAVLGLRQTAEPSIVKVETPPSADQIDKLVNQRVEEKMRELNASSVAAAVDQQQSAVKEPASRRTNRTTVRYEINARRPLTRVEREQLAADLRLTSATDNSEPNLLSDTINQ